MPAPAAPSSPEPVRDHGPYAWSQSVPAWDGATVAREAIDAWTCAMGAWGDYLVRLSGARSPADVMDAGSRLMADNLEICGRATAAHLRDAGVTAPLLNDA